MVSEAKKLSILTIMSIYIIFLGKIKFIKRLFVDVILKFIRNQNVRAF